MPFILLVVMIFFKNIWNFKDYLKSKKNPNKLLLRVYEYYFHRYSAWIGYKSEISESIIFPHGFYGVFISNDAIIGNNTVIFNMLLLDQTR